MELGYNYIMKLTSPRIVEDLISPSLLSSELMELLKEAYVFMGADHKATRPWGKNLERWTAAVETCTGWNYFEESERMQENFKQTNKTNT